MIKRVATALLCTVAPVALTAQDVDLRSTDEFISVEGQIIGFNGVMVRVQTSVGAVSVPASEVICYGAGCLETIANNDFGLTAEAFEGVVVDDGSSAPEGGNTDSFQIAFASSAAAALFNSLADLFSQQSGSQTAAVIDGNVTTLENAATNQSATLTVTSDGSAADINVQTVALSGTQTAAFDGPSGWSSNTGLTHQMVGLNAFSVIVAPSAGINQISVNDLARIYAGEVTNWSQIGGADVGILPLQMPTNSATGAEIAALVMAPAGKDISSNVLTMNDEAGIATSINQFPGSISVVSTTNADPSRTIPVSGSCGIPVDASAFNVASGDYPLVRPVMAAYGTSPSTDLIPEMLDFASQSAAQAAIEGLGYANYSAMLQDASLKNARLSGLLGASLDDVQRAAAAEMFQVLFAADRMSTTFTGGPASGPEGGWNRAMMNGLIDALSDPSNAGREIIFVGFGVSSAGSQSALDASAAAAADFAATLQAAAPAVISGGDYTLSSYGFADVAPSSCIDGQVAGSEYTRIEVWIR